MKIETLKALKVSSFTSVTQKKAIKFITSLLAHSVPIDCIDVNHWNDSPDIKVYLTKPSQTFGKVYKNQFNDTTVKSALIYFNSK